MIKLPKQVLDMFPRWEYCCPNCGTYVEAGKGSCPGCKTAFDEKSWRVPPRFLENSEAMSEYAHKVLAPKLTGKQRELLFRYFTEFFSDGFESGDFTAWSGTVGSPSVQSVVKHCGSYAFSATGTANSYVYKNFGAQSTLFVRFYSRWINLNTISFSRPLRVVGNSNIVTTVSVQSDKISYYRSGWYDGYMTVNTNTWYCIEFEFVKHASEGVMRLYVDGAELVGETNIDTSGFSDPDSIRVGLTEYGNVNTTVYVDCVVVADTLIGPESAQQTYTKTWTTDALFKKLGITKSFGVDSALQKTVTVQKQVDALLKKLNIPKTFGVDAYLGAVEHETCTVTFGLTTRFAYKVRLPELWLDENGKLVLNISQPYTWVGN
ncbi:MAG: hypothetical protein WC325_05930 [Candidatus Bathyarchaeia archaeon]|jgi:hypothetical protein